MPASISIILAQLNPVVGDLAGNVQRIITAARAAPRDADLIVFPELSLTGYIPEDLLLKPFFIDQVEAALRDLLAQTTTLKPHILIGAPHRLEGKLYNAAHLIGHGKLDASVRKHHLPNYGVFDEARVFAAGPYPKPVPFKGTQLGIMICEDMWKTDVARHLHRHGAELLIVTNASPYELNKLEQRFTTARACVAATGLPLLYINQVGGQDEIIYDGASFALNESGTLIAQAAFCAEDAPSLTFRKAAPNRWLISGGTMASQPSEHEAIYTALMTGLRDYVTKNGFTGTLLGLSGGIDSALAAAIAVDAVGPAAVHGVSLPSRFTSSLSNRDARTLARRLGITLERVPIAAPVNAFERVIARHLPPNAPGIVHENIQPRARGVILMALSNATGRLLLSTGNKSEVAVGYATLYGDMCGGFNPLKDIYKTQVYALAKWRNTAKPAHGLGPTGKVIPKSTIERPPTAELKPDQTDQDTLPPYDVLDSILENLIERDHSLAEIVALGHDAATVRRVWQMLDRAEYKRRQAAPGVKITSKAFGRERRYPITNHFSAGE